MRMNRFVSLRLIGLSVGSVAALLMVADPCAAEADGQSYNSPAEAARALLKAAEIADWNGVVTILGPSSKELLITTDRAADERVRAEFVRRAKEKMSIAADPEKPGQRMLSLGKDKWPFPIPLVQSGGKWHFDIDQGKQEILIRRIGRNEIAAIEVCRGYVEAQDQYFDRSFAAGGVRQYAQTFISSPGHRDGLYWPSTGAHDDSPIGELVAQAIAEGYAKRGEPFHGYYFKILQGQGSRAPGGAMDYMDHGRMSRGFAMIAWPSGYESTGVMTFLVSRNGIVYQKDLGTATGELAGSMTLYDPDNTWTPVSGLGIPKSLTSARVPSR